MRLSMIVGVLIMAWTVLVGAAILVGHVHTEPNQLQALGFDFCSGKPC